MALAAERVAAAPSRAVSAGAAGSALVQVPDIGRFVGRTVGDSIPLGIHPSVSVDPFDARPTVVEQSGVASPAVVPTVSSRPAPGSRLTAILVADDRRVAVIDDATVTVGEVLTDGARVSAIQPDRVWIVDANGRWRMLTLNRGTR